MTRAIDILVKMWYNTSMCNSDDFFVERFDNMNDIDIQSETVIEIVVAQYEDLAFNLRPELFQKTLILKHQNDNPYDHNAVILVTDDGEELGFLPKSYAYLYAQAIDSGRYAFSVDILKADLDPETPKLIVKINCELVCRKEEEIESDILGFVQNIVNVYDQTTKEYLTFIYSDKVNVEELLSVLDRARLVQKLLLCSKDVIQNHAIKPNADSIIPITKEYTDIYLNKLQTDISDVLKKIQKAYNGSLDIDDEEEYHRVQSEIRERRKRFRLYDELLVSLIDVAQDYVDITAQINTPLLNNHDAEKKKSAQEEANVSAYEYDDTQFVSDITPELETDVLPDRPQLTEQAFFDWLVSVGGLTDTTAKQYISNIHSIEKLYQNIFGIRQNILGATSTDNAAIIIEALIKRSEYIDANDRRHNGFSISLSKFAQFADISVLGLKNTSDKKHYQPPVSTLPYIVKTVDFENPHNCTYYKPCVFIFNERQYSVKSWFDLYKQFLILLYADNTYSDIIKSLNGRSIYGHRIDFTDKSNSNKLRRPIRVSENFFAEGNLSAADIIKHIKCLMELCSIGDEQMIIKYSAQEEDNEIVLPDGYNDDVTADLKPPSEISTSEQKIDLDYDQELTRAKDPSINAENSPASVLFTPNTVKPFVLGDALVEILLTDAPEVTKYCEHKGGISTKNLRELIKKYYGKTIDLFEMAKILLVDKRFQLVGKGCYIVNKALISQQDVEPENIENNRSEDIISEPVHTASPVFIHEEPTADCTFDPKNGAALTIDAIIEVINENIDALQYEDGFGAYEVKSLLSHKGYTNVSEDEIEALMSGCSELCGTEDGYYTLVRAEKKTEASVGASDKAEDYTKDPMKNAAETPITKTVEYEPPKEDSDARNVILRLNGNVIRAYDYSDALNKVCEFSINCKPFKMARMNEQDILLHGNSVFYRKPVPVDGCNRLSNGLQITAVSTLSDLQTITSAVKRYCQIDDDMITIISR